MAYVGFGVGGLGLVVGTVATIMTAGKASALKEDYCEGNLCRNSARSDYDSAMLIANVANVGFVVAGVGAAVGVLSLYLPGNSEPTSATATKTTVGRLRAGLGAASGSGTVWLRGAF